MSTRIQPVIDTQDLFFDNYDIMPKCVTKMPLTNTILEVKYNKAKAKSSVR